MITFNKQIIKIMRPDICVKIFKNKKIIIYHPAIIYNIKSNKIIDYINMTNKNIYQLENI